MAEKVCINIELHLPVGTTVGAILETLQTALSVAEDQGQIDAGDFALATSFVEILTESFE